MKNISFDELDPSGDIFHFIVRKNVKESPIHSTYISLVCRGLCPGNEIYKY
jgi:hypothetical protein